MGQYDRKHSNISKQSAQSRALKRKSKAERREQRQIEEGLDLAQRREIISDIAVVEAQTAEINRRFAEFHANDQFPAGG